MTLDRKRVFPEAELPDWRELVAEGRKLAASVTVGRSPFLDHYGVASESDYKRRAMAERRLMFHGQIGFREAEKSRRAYALIHDQLAKRGYRVDRYGICLDWSMGYPAARRANMPRGTGLIMRGVEDFVAMTAMAPVAPHFGDFVIGTPASLENTAAALQAGSTSIGNLGQYFTFRQPHWDDDVQVTAESIKAIALAAAQPVEVLVHSNLDDGFAALFTDLACSLGAILIEKHLIEGLLGGRVGHCFGNTFSKPFARLAFQRAAARATDTPGTMVYGATTMYGASHTLNFAALANYLRLDIAGQRSRPTGHAVNPVPVTEAERIPDIDEVIDAHLFANRVAELEDPLAPLIDFAAADAVADRIVAGGERFKARVLTGLVEAGIDVANPFELMLAIRRIGSKPLEE
ncbi:MAG: cobalamin-dependent protein, partial [Alphaproteobacteria bacterium]